MRFCAAGTPQFGPCRPQLEAFPSWRLRTIWSVPGWFALLPGEGENFAHRLLAKTARDLGFLVDHDAAANTYVTMAGRDRTRPRVIIGSHLDSVWDGGNFDGAAGVVAGLIAIKALKESGGNWRLPAARIIGKYDHCGGVPRAYRHDSVVAGADFIHALDELWREWDAAGRDMAHTVGKFYTDPQQHALTKISGEASFSLDVRSLDAQSLAQLEERVHAIANAIAARRGDPDGLGSTGTPCGERETGGQHKFPNSHMTLA